jgi:pimeloyl-ACP methyl ester carboxylesterase
MGTGEQPSLWAKLAQLQLPVHLIAGELDEKFVDINRRMAAQISGATLSVVPNAGHTVHLEHPERFRSIVLGLCSTITV